MAFAPTRLYTITVVYPSDYVRQHLVPAGTKFAAAARKALSLSWCKPGTTVYLDGMKTTRRVYRDGSFQIRQL